MFSALITGIISRMWARRAERELRLPSLVLTQWTSPDQGHVADPHWNFPPILHSQVGGTQQLTPSGVGAVGAACAFCMDPMEGRPIYAGGYCSWTCVFDHAVETSSSDGDC